MEAADQAYSGQDKNSAHDERSQNSPKQHLVLLLGRHTEITKDYEENEKIIYAEREFYNVASYKFQRHRTPMPEVNQYCKSGRQGQPHGTPAEGFTETNSMRSPAEDPKIEGQHGHDEQVEENPEEEQRNLCLIALGERSENLRSTKYD